MDARPIAPSCTPEEFSRLLERMRDGDRRAESQLFPVVYDELRKLAAAKLRSPEFFRLQGRPTSIVHDAYLRLGANQIRAQDRVQFFGLMARVMHNLLVDRVRGNAALKRSGQWARVEMPDVAAPAPATAFDIEALSKALEEFREEHAELFQLLEMHYFGEAPIKEIAAATGKAERTVKLHLKAARALFREKLERTGLIPQ